MTREKMDKVVGFYREAPIHIPIFRYPEKLKPAPRKATPREILQANKPKPGVSSSKGPTESETGLKRVYRLASRDGWTCKLCGEPVDPKIRKGWWRGTSDHIIPRSLGGTYRLDNLQLAHAICNERRGNKPLDSDS